MYRTFAIAFFIQFCLPTFAQEIGWMPIEKVITTETKNKTVVTFENTYSIHYESAKLIDERSPFMVQAWFKHLKKRVPTRLSNGKLVYLEPILQEQGRFLMVFDCKGNTHQLKTASRYDTKGNFLSREKEDPELEATVPETVAFTLASVACSFSGRVEEPKKALLNR